jgi:hypothetical protein
VDYLNCQHSAVVLVFDVVVDYWVVVYFLAVVVVQIKRINRLAVGSYFQLLFVTFCGYLLYYLKAV